MPLQSFRRVLIANRGEIAVRIARAASELGSETVAVYSAADAESLHTRVTDRAVELPGAPIGAYLDIDAVVAAAVAQDPVVPHTGHFFRHAGSCFCALFSCVGLSSQRPFTHLHGLRPLVLARSENNS